MASAGYNDNKYGVSGGRSLKAEGRKLAERSRGSQDYYQPREGLTLTKLSLPVVGGAIRMAAAIPWRKGQEDDRIVVNDRQATLIYSTPNADDAKKMLALKSIKLDGKECEVSTYMAALESCGKGVLHGLDLRLSEKELELAFSHRQNPPMLGVRRMGNSTSVIITFAGDYVPRWMIGNSGILPEKDSPDSVETSSGGVESCLYIVASEFSPLCLCIFFTAN
ncbi:hypothetical protein HPB48_021209 [Haemaphysalis longicornis]|uniref:Uncharacterized protein n=1 Tax=Haemaphysalis longicornis TaxID=44386 RepID=A0A9J6FUE0_HAELO|nr:hypothetical protein HPB48_021209 [Haemaphysalis longicornis]